MQPIDIKRKAGYINMFPFVQQGRYSRYRYATDVENAVVLAICILPLLRGLRDEMITMAKPFLLEKVL